MPLYRGRLHTRATPLPAWPYSFRYLTVLMCVFLIYKWVSVWGFQMDCLVLVVVLYFVLVLVVGLLGVGLEVLLDVLFLDDY